MSGGTGRRGRFFSESACTAETQCYEPVGPSVTQLRVYEAMKNALTFLTVISVVGATSVASAQGEDDEWVDESTDLTAPKAPKTAPAAMTDNAPAVTTGTDHDRTVGAWGFQVVDSPTFVAALGPDSPGLQMIGVRKWGTRTSGWEAGAIFNFTQLGAEPEPTVAVFGGTFGYLRTMGIYKHMSVFWEPQASIVLVAPNDGVDGTDDPTQLLLQGKFSIGAEVRLGWFGIPELGVTAKISGGLEIANNGDESDFSIGTQGGFANSIRGLVRTGVGFVYYIP